MRSNITLSNGRIVTHKPMPNGATEAYMLDNGNTLPAGVRINKVYR